MSENDKVEVKEEEVVEQPKVEVQTEDEKRAGIKEVVSNSEAMAIEKDKGEPKQDKLPSFFVDKTSRHRVEIDILSSREDGKIMSVSRKGLGLDFGDFAYLRHSEEWFDFTIPTYEDMSTYRTRCASFRRELGQMLVDRLALRNYLLIWHLTDWSLKDRDGQKVELVQDADTSLNDASVKRVYSLHPMILDVVLTIFEKDILLT